jgi:hypothetical protein
MAFDILSKKEKYSDSYTLQEKGVFEEYCDYKISDFDGDKAELKEIFLSIYSNAMINCQ